MFLGCFFVVKAEIMVWKNKLPAVKESVKSRYIRFFLKKVACRNIFFYICNAS